MILEILLYLCLTKKSTNWQRIELIMKLNMKTVCIAVCAAALFVACNNAPTAQEQMNENPAAAICENGLYAYEEGNYEEAVKCFEEAAEQGDAIAQYYLGVCYLTAKSVEQNHEEAARWFTKSAEQGVAGAQYYLGALYHWGQGVEQNLDTAKKWYAAAAEQGNEEAKACLRKYWDEHGEPLHGAETCENDDDEIE